MTCLFAPLILFANVAGGMNQRTGDILPVLIGLFVLFDVVVILIIVLTVRRRKGP